MSNPSHCPLCYGELETRDVAPCMDCGWDPQELEHFTAGKHSYAELEVLFGERLVLCDFCQVDFASYDPTFVGLDAGACIGLKDMRFVRDIDGPSLGKDKFCPSCHHRLAFLEFVARVRETAPNHGLQRTRRG